MLYQIKQSELPPKIQDLIDSALLGTPVFIEFDNKVMVQLLPIRQLFHQRKAGSAKGMVKMADDFDAPLEDFDEYTS
jgi:antitoxin (DNA-binding transcriptional repressor) of toxin-antitoxin stability system